MTRRCFFVEQIGPDAEEVLLTGQTAHHVQGVLRLRDGDSLELRDGRGNGWQGLIVGRDKGAVRVRLTGRQSLQNESPLRLTLAMAFARTDRMDLVVRQATELGVDRFVAYRSGRSQYGLSDARVGKRRERWRRIALEAMCQCGRMRVPEICVVPDLQELIGSPQDATQRAVLRLLALEGERRSSVADIWRSSPQCEEVLAVVGPEGGWTAEEVREFLAAGCHAVHLGPRILRLETAAVAFVVLAQSLWGDLRCRVC